MKTKLILGLTMLTGVAAIAQENDDLYFRSKDREKLEATRATEQTYVSNYDNFKKKHFNETTELDEYTNPTDSYSARNVNPEYISRSYSDQVSEDEANYFVEGYAPATSNNNFNYNSGYYYNGFNNNAGWNSWYGPQFNNAWGWNDPWMNPYWGNRSMNPYWGNRWGSGWSLSAGYFWGNSWGNNWGNNWGWGWNDPWMNPYNPYNRWGSSWSYWNQGWYRPTTVVVVGDGAVPNYGKRPTRSSAGVTEVTNGYVRPSRSNSNVDSGNGDAGGRNKTSNDYYVRPSRRTTTNTSGYTNSNSTNSSNWNNTNSTMRESRSSTFSSPTRSTSGNTNSGYSPTRSSSSGNNNSYSPSRSTGSSGGYTPSRSSSSGSSGSSGSSSRPSRGGN